MAGIGILALSAVAAAGGALEIAHNGDLASGCFYLLVACLCAMRGLADLVPAGDEGRRLLLRLRIQGIAFAVASLIFLSVAIGTACGVISFPDADVGDIGITAICLVGAAASAYVAALSLRFLR